MQLKGIHHVTAITANAQANNRFYTEVMGMRRVKKTVNQDDISAYHLFFADGAGTPGSDLTFFDWPVVSERRGTHSISRTGLIINDDSFEYWARRLNDNGVLIEAPKELNGRFTMDFEDPEGQRFRLTAGDKENFASWDKSRVPAGHQIRGLGPVTISVTDIRGTELVLRPDGAPLSLWRKILLRALLSPHLHEKLCLIPIIKQELYGDGKVAVQEV